MVYKFISKWTSHDIQGIGTLKNDVPFLTEDEAVAEKLRKINGVFEVKAQVFEKIEEAKKVEDTIIADVANSDQDHEVAIAKLKKRPKNIQGMRTASEVKQEGE